MKKTLFFILLAITTGLFSGCQNNDWSFPDYEYSAVYFAYQSPIRTICLGEDVFDTTFDNEYKCQIMATMGGVYSNKNDIEIGIRVDNSLTDDLIFEDTETDIIPMPSEYYSLSSDKIKIKKGDIIGGVTVQLTDAFFNDPKSLSTTYVIPVVMTGVIGADSILSGVPLVDNPRRAVESDWDVLSKDYILYAVKYINKYDSNFLRRGKDVFTGSQTGTITRHAEYVEKDEVITDITSRSLKTIAWDHQTKDMNDNTTHSELLITFDNEGNCTVASGSSEYTASGTGKFVSKGDKNSWGDQDRDVLYLDYTIDYGDFQCATTDTLVVRDRGMKAEWFTPAIKE